MRMVRVGVGVDTDDGVTQRCTPICKPGYVYDPVTKKCLKAEEALHL